MKTTSSKTIALIMVFISAIVFLFATLLLMFGETLDLRLNVIGIRMATLFVAFSAFCSSTLFSLLILLHNKTVSKINDDTNKRAEMFRELQFASSNYSIIEFMDRMLIYEESTRYVDRFIRKQNMTFHMLSADVREEDVYHSPKDYHYMSVRIPFRVVEGKMVSSIMFTRLKFERDGEVYDFITPPSLKDSRAFLLYNEHTKRNNIIINLITPKDSKFLSKEAVNEFTKIKIYIKITSLLGVQVKGISELYFTNPETSDGVLRNTYKINSSNFTLLGMPVVSKLDKAGEN